HYQKLLKTYLLPYGWWLGGLVFLLFGGLVLSLLNPLLLSRFIDGVSSGEPIQSLLIVALLFLGVALLKQVVALIETFVAENLSLLATNKLRTDLMLHCLRLDLDFHTVHTPGELIERVDGDVTTLNNFFSRFMISLVGNVLLALGVLIMLFRIDWRVGVMLTALVLVALVVLLRLRNIAGSLWEREREASAALFGFLEERLAGTEDVRSSGAVAYMLHGLAVHSRNLLRRFRRASQVNFLSFGAPTMVVFALANGIALLMGVYLFSIGAISIGTVYLLFSYSNLLRTPVEQIIRQMGEMQQVSGSVIRIFKLLDERSTIADGPGVELPPGPLALVFHDVSFSYTEDVPVLCHISFSLRPGEVLGLLGRTGSGKSTVTRLVTRLCDPIEGTVYLGGIDLRTTRFDDVRPRIGMVTQDVHVLDATVRDNLTLFDPTILDAKIVRALQLLGLEEWYTRLPQGLDTPLAPGGTGLSAGEAQLLAFARVFLRDPDLVILDEASSRLDPATEHRLEQAIDTLLVGRTAIIIAHRLATVQRANTIMILENGECREYGERAILAHDPASRFAQLLRVGLEADNDDNGVEPEPQIATQGKDTNI
ncbi:MAG: ABC transporter ATP-binding protein, partial [Ktedonobacteraceae bacterium]|nr:ABC transporter ATP-binding protein [Ktedonobacteraceae bacterium]